MVRTAGAGSAVLRRGDGEHLDAAAGGVPGEGEDTRHPAWWGERGGMWALSLCGSSSFVGWRDVRGWRIHTAPGDH